MTDRPRRRAAAPPDSTSREDNPFAPPPEGQPDQPWRPRVPARSESAEERSASKAGPENSDGPRGANGSGNGGDDSGARAGSGAGAGSGSGSAVDGSDGSDGSGSGDEPSSWGSRWSSRQPGRQSGGFGRPRGLGGSGDPERDGAGEDGGSGEGGGEGQGGGPRGMMRWDPTDPLQRHARYALHAGIWALFFALFSLPQVALLLGALSLYWGVSALRGKSRTTSGRSGKDKSASGSGGKVRKAARSPHAKATAEDIAGSDRTSGGGTDADAERQSPAAVQVAVSPAQAAKAQATAAVGGLIAGVLALALVAATFTFQMVYNDYYTCTQDALTQSSRQDCKRLLPEQLRPFLENRS